MRASKRPSNSIGAAWITSIKRASWRLDRSKSQYPRGNGSPRFIRLSLVRAVLSLSRPSTPKRWTKNTAVTVWLTKVDHLGASIRSVLSHDLRIWRHPSIDPSKNRPKKATRIEYYAWLLGLTVGARVIRYGCDRYWNDLKKPARQ